MNLIPTKTINLTKPERDVLVNMIGCNRYGGEFEYYIACSTGVSWFVFERITYPIPLHQVEIVISLIEKGVLSDSTHGVHVLTDIGRETLNKLNNDKKRS